MTGTGSSKEPARAQGLRDVEVEHNNVRSQPRPQGDIGLDKVDIDLHTLQGARVRVHPRRGIELVEAPLAIVRGSICLWRQFDFIF